MGFSYDVDDPDVPTKGAGADTPLSLRFEMRSLWPALQAEFGCDQTTAAMILALVTASGWVSYSRNHNNYSGADRFVSPLYTHARVTRGADWLDASRLVDHIRVPPGQRGLQSVLRARPELIERAMRAIDGMPLKVAMPMKVIWLRDADGRFLPYTETRERMREARRIDAFNEALLAADIEGTEITPVVRMYHGTLDRGGRHYALGPSWQNAPKANRALIKIEKEPVLEPDFRNMHPSMLYQDRGLTPPEDAYDVGGPWERDLVKVATNVLFNARRYSDAVGAIAAKDGRHEDPKRRKKLMDTLAELGSDEARHFARELIRDVKRAHKPIAGDFHSDAGARLMVKDSAMAADVMASMLKRGVIVLPVHDSFVVPARSEGHCQAAMREAADKAGYPLLRVA